MVVKGIVFVLQMLLFLVLFALGSVFLPFFPALPVWQIQTGPGRVFVLDGLVFAFVFFLVSVGLLAARKRLRDSGLRTSAAFVLAVLLGLLMRFGFKSL